MKTKNKILGIVTLLIMFCMSSQAFAKGGKDGAFFGGFGGFHNVNTTDNTKMINLGGRLGYNKGMIGGFFDFSYYLKKDSFSNMQPKIGVNLRFPFGGSAVGYLGGHGSFNMMKVAGLTSKKVLGFGAQAGVDIFFGGNFSLFLEGHFEYWLKKDPISAKRFLVLGGIGGVAIHF